MASITNIKRLIQEKKSTCSMMNLNHCHGQYVSL